LATPLGKKKDQSAAMAGKIPKPGEIDAENIQRLNFEQLLAEDQKALDDIEKKIREEKEQVSDPGPQDWVHNVVERGLRD
jgi:hypothetical protein